MTIPFNYFFQQYSKKCNELILEDTQNKLGPIDKDDFDLMDFLMFRQTLEKEKMIEIRKKALWEICANYIGLTNLEITVYPKEPFEFVHLILHSEKETTYQESFQLSLQLIYQDFLAYLGVGCPAIWQSQDFDQPTFEITLDSKNKINKIETHKMNLLEQNEAMTRLVLMMMNQQLGPLPKTLIRKREDI